MRFLSSALRADNDERIYGVFTSWKRKTINTWIQQGKPWAGDNMAFGGGWQPDIYFPWLETITPYRETCLFLVVPDCLGDAEATLVLWDQWANDPRFAGWPLAFVAQDGQEALPLPESPEWVCLFIGGTTAWKDSEAAIAVIKRGQALGKHIHIGRVNYWRRYALFAQIRGSEEFTCDGTRPRYAGYDNAIDAWAEYERRHGEVLPLW